MLQALHSGLAASRLKPLTISTAKTFSADWGHANRRLETIETV